MRFRWSSSTRSPPRRRLSRPGRVSCSGPARSSRFAAPVDGAGGEREHRVEGESLDGEGATTRGIGHERRRDRRRDENEAEDHGRDAGAPAAGPRDAQVDEAAGKQDGELRGDRGGAMVPESQADLRRAGSRSELRPRAPAKALQADTPSRVEDHLFQLEPEALENPRRAVAASDADPALGVHDAVPRNPAALIERAQGVADKARVAGQVASRATCP